jgi:hypothetical protein
MGIEPTLAAWEAAVLPLNYTRPMKPHRTRIPHDPEWYIPCRGLDNHRPSLPLKTPGKRMSHGDGPGRLTRFRSWLAYAAAVMANTRRCTAGFSASNRSHRLPLE